MVNEAAVASVTLAETICVAEELLVMPLLPTFRSLPPIV